MRNIKKTVILLLFLITITSVLLNSCRKYKDFFADDFDAAKYIENEFYEVNNLSDSLWLSGSLAAPILNTRLTLVQLLPKPTDSSLWVEVGQDELIHLRAYYKEIAVAKVSEIYSGIPLIPGIPIPVALYKFKSDTSKLKIYSSALSGHLFFKNPKFTFKFTNEIPIVSYFRLDTITFHEVNAQHDSISYTKGIFHTIKPAASQNVAAKDSVIIDNTVIPDFDKIFSPIPRLVSYIVTVGNDFPQQLYWNLTGEEKISIDVDVDLPLEARLYDFSLGDTIPFDLSGDTYKQAKSLELRLEIENFLPFETLSQVIFTDSLNNFKEIYFPKPGWVIKSGVTNSSGIVTTSTISRVTMKVDQEMLQRLKDNKVTKITYSATFNTEDSFLDGNFIKIYSYNWLGLKIGVKLDFGGSTTDI